MNNVQTKSNIYFESILIVTYALHYLLNFLSHPYAAFSILAITVLTFFYVLLMSPSKVVIALICYIFIEGQGRILWNYHSFFRIAFDLYCFILVIRIFKTKKKTLSAKIVTMPIIVLFILHTLWIGLTIFNPMGAAPIYSFAAIKYYTIPFLLFFALSLIDELKDISYLKRLSFFVVIMTFLTCILCIYQMVQGENSIYGMSANYYSLFNKHKNFTGYFFRPWGTSHDAGAMAVFLNLSVGFIFIFFWKKTKTWNIVSLLLVITLSWYTLFICQVRSASIKHTAIILSIMGIFFIRGSKRIQKVLLASSITLVFLFAGVYFQKESVFKKFTENTNFALTRYMSLFEPNFKHNRASTDIVLMRMKTQVNWPFGYGPGMVTNFLPGITTRRNEMIGVNLDHLWSGDNFFLFSFLELGLGAVLYILLFLAIPLTLGVRWLKLDRQKYPTQSSLILIVISIQVITIVGNWGAVGLAFNPESFFYWLWSAIGIQNSSSQYFVQSIPHQNEEHVQ